MKSIRYRSGYKYQLAEDCVCQTEITGIKIDTPHILLNSDGVLVVRAGYAWDGPSGPTIDTKTFMRGSLVHDALYQLMRRRWLDQSNRKAADDLMRQICIEDGMWKVRAWWVYRGVRKGGAPSASPENVKRVIIAP